MTTIDEIMAAAYAPAAMAAAGRSFCPRLAAAELRTLITQAIAEARAEGARDAKREPVLLTDEQIRAMSRCPAKCSEVNGLRLMDAPLQFARAIEAAVLAANGMTK